jgi:hypothetical protein
VSDSVTELRREVRTLRRCFSLTVAALIVAGLAAFQRSVAVTRFDEIDAQRINIREPDGKLRMVLSNRSRSTGPIAHGKPFGYPGGSRPGIIFFNDEETENGGPVFEGKQLNGVRDAGAQLSFDQYDQDQVVTLVYDDQRGQRNMGLNVIDRADTSGAQRVAGSPMLAPRVFVGRDPSRSATLLLSDPFGRPRLRLAVDSLGTARIEFLDGRGRVVRQIAAAATDTVRQPD